MLSMSMHFVDALFRFVANGRYFVGLHIRFDNFGDDFRTLYGRCTDRNFLAIDHEQWLEARRLIGLFQQFDMQTLALTDEVLLATSCNDCFFHKVTFQIFSYQQILPDPRLSVNYTF